MKDNKHVVMCVDDDKDFLDSLKILIESEGYVMVAANSAEEGRRLFRMQDPDLILVDLMMEEVDSGTTLVRDIRATGGKQPIYMLSSVGDNLNRNIDYTDLGLSGILQKPINPTTLISTLKAKLK